jgi:nucleoside triphosphatase
MSNSKYPEPTVGALIIRPDGKLFLMRTHKWRDKWCVPGGHVDLGETVENAVIREVKEETNLDVHDLEFICYQESIYDEAFWKSRHFIFIDFSCKTDSTDVILNDEAQEHAWIGFDELDTLPIESYTLNLISRYADRHGIALKADPA